MPLIDMQMNRLAPPSAHQLRSDLESREKDA